MISIQCKCGEEIDERRWKLGYRICLECGDEAAKQEIASRSKRILPLGNKMGYGLIGGQTLEEQKADVLGRSGKGRTKHNV